MLTIVVIAKNEEGRLRPCLESIKWADEIIILDNGSTDKTVEVANQYTDKVFTFSDLDFSSLRNKGMEKANGDWVLYVDADERILDSLKVEVEELVSITDKSAFAISRKNIIFGQEAKYGPFWPDWVIRLIKKKDFATWVGKVHEYPKFKGDLGYTKNSLLHLTHRNLDQVVLKSLDWSRIDSKLRIEANHPKMNGWRFLRILCSEFFYQGIVRKGFFNGTVGIIDSTLQTFSLFMTYVRLWEIQQDKSLDVTYDGIDDQLRKNNFKYP